jgi:phosphatidylserine decarboxylase
MVSLAPEGWRPVLVALAAATVLQVAVGFAAALPAWVLLVLLMVAFREVVVTPPSLPLALVSPLHGRVTVAEVGEDPYLQRRAVLVEVGTSWLGMRGICSPTEGKLIKQWTGSSRQAGVEPRSNNSFAYWIQTDEGDDIVLVIDTGRRRGPVKLNYQPGERVGHGRRIGFAYFGCKVRVYAASDCEIDTEPGQQLVAGESIIATMVHTTAVSNGVAAKNNSIG